ncbi:MAG TPA: pyridoxamine 5'-phosphate oxidase family protein [Candidatus Paceibacterota bacterium]
MNNFNEKDQTDIANFILNNLPDHKQFALGTVDQSGHPWVVCLNLAYDNKINIIWKSSKDTEHSKHIRNNPNVSICIFSETKEKGDFGLYLKGVAHEVVDIFELETSLKVRYGQKGKEIPPMSEFLGDSSNRIYCAEIQEAWATDSRHIKPKIDLEILRSAVENI